jgi:hypothetical protein
MAGAELHIGACVGVALAPSNGVIWLMGAMRRLFDQMLNRRD